MHRMQPMHTKRLQPFLETFDITTVFTDELIDYDPGNNERMQGINELHIIEMVDRFLPADLAFSWAKDQSYVYQWMREKKIIHFTRKEAVSLWKGTTDGELFYTTPEFLFHIAKTRNLTVAQLHEVEYLLGKIGQSLGFDIPDVPPATDAQIKDAFLTALLDMAKARPKVAHRLFKEQLIVNNLAADVPYSKFLKMMDDF